MGEGEEYWRTSDWSSTVLTMPSPSAFGTDPLDTSGAPFSCKDCPGLSFAFRGLLEKHGAEAHGGKENMVCYEKECAQVFKRRMTLIYHLRENKHRDKT